MDMQEIGYLLFIQKQVEMKASAAATDIVQTEPQEEQPKPQKEKKWFEFWK